VYAIAVCVVHSISRLSVMLRQNKSVFPGSKQRNLFSGQTVRPANDSCFHEWLDALPVELRDLHKPFASLTVDIKASMVKYL
jgi:hypothetical protein